MEKEPGCTADEEQDSVLTERNLDVRAAPRRPFIKSNWRGTHRKRKAEIVHGNLK